MPHLEIEKVRIIIKFFYNNRCNKKYLNDEYMFIYKTKYKINLSVICNLFIKLIVIFIVRLRK